MPPKKDGTNDDGDVKGVGLDDSNMANYGSKEHIDARKKAAQSEKEYVGAGKKPGIEIWRVENKRTASDTPDFGIKRWPKDQYGKFFSGDSYVLLNTYQTKDENGKLTDKLAWDIHFWLGKTSSQDEQGVAAYKTVELDDLLDDAPVQHRETQGFESQLFKSYFPRGIIYMDGGIDSGFRKVKPEDYKPRLFQIRGTGKNVKAYQVPVKVSSLHQGDVFILDAGLTIYTFIGKSSDAFERMKAAALATDIKSGRGKAKLSTNLDENFWKILGGKESDVGPAVDKEPEQVIDVDKNTLKLWKLSDASGKMTFTKVAEGTLQKSMLDSNDVFVIDAGIEVFVWVGKSASAGEKSQSMKQATNYLTEQSKPHSTPITVIKEGQLHHVFSSLFGEKGHQPVDHGGVKGGGGGGGFCVVM
jgi:gelsolin